MRFNPLDGLNQASLNLQTILNEGSNDINRLDKTTKEAEREEKTLDLLLRLTQMLPLGPDTQFIEEVKELYHQDTNIKSFIDGLAEVVLDRVLLPHYGFPKVGKSQQILTLDDALQFYEGMKFGVVEITGKDSKLSLCNTAVDNFRKVWWDDWQFLITDADTAYTPTTWNRTGELFFNWVGRFFRWPYDTIYNCYWATDEMIYRYEDLLVPLFMQPMREDGTFEKVGFWSNILFNFAFNAGYQMRDVIWIFYMTENEGWYDREKELREDQLEAEFLLR